MGDTQETVKEEAEIREPEKDELMAMDQEEVVDMFLRLVEAKNYIQLELMSLAMGNDRNINLLRHLNSQMKGKDIFIEAVLDEIGRDKLPEGMELYSGDDYVLFREEANRQKADFTEKAKPNDNGGGGS